MDARSIDRRNRRRFGLLGLLLIALGICGLLARAGLLALVEPSALYLFAREEAQRQPELALAAAMLVGLLLVLLGIHWLREQFAPAPTRVRELALTHGALGNTTVSADVITRALSRDVARERGIYDVSARMMEVGPRPRIVVRAAVDGDVDVAQLRADLEGPFRRITDVLGSEGVDTHLHVKPIPAPRTRVR